MTPACRCFTFTGQPAAMFYPFLFFLAVPLGSVLAAERPFLSVESPSRKLREVAHLVPSGICFPGFCVNCAYCDGDCFSQCTCISDLNFCCCPTPPGHFSRGYGKVPCPGGTYQDDRGEAGCKACNTTNETYHVHTRGAIDPVDCQESKCSKVCGSGNSINTTCEAECKSAPEIASLFSVRSVSSTAFCLTLGIEEAECSW